ncbi:hypothetical protein ZWY2020_013047 [Hordeum vulgare]|nr:hypothetical protein ZWY2020_013047 [Hordeum vulgare]
MHFDASMASRSERWPQEDSGDAAGDHGATIAGAAMPSWRSTAGTAPTGGSGLRRGGSRLRVKVPSASQLPPLPEDAAAIFDNIECRFPLPRKHSCFCRLCKSEEPPEEVRAMCAQCNSLERLVKFLPCRHASYCDRCFAFYDRRPARPQLCPVCWKPYTRGHPESGGVQPKPKKGSK